MTILDFFFYLTMFAFVFMCIILIFLVLIQKGRGGGLSGAFGGGGGNTAFGAKTGDVLTWATSVVFGIFLLLAVAMNLIANKRFEKSTATAALTVKAPVPAAPVQSPIAPPEQPTTAPAGPTSAPLTGDIVKSIQRPLNSSTKP